MTTTTPAKSSSNTPKQGNSQNSHNAPSSVSLKQPPKKCSLNENHCLSLGDILHSFSTPISEEHAWALTYQLAKCFANALRTDPKRCRIVRTLSEVFVHKDGHVHPTTIFRDDVSMDQNQVDGGSGPTEAEVVAGLGIVMFEALDFGMDEDEERHLSPEMSRLMAIMIPSQGREAVLDDPLEEEPPPEELDDEGIGTDSYFPEDEHHTTSLSRILKDCTVHLGCGGSQEADSHYRAVCRALVAEALELSTFLERVGTGEIRKETTDHLIKSDWARLWMQVVRELRRGVQLKKVCYTRKPIEFELTPYEILMEDIRSRRYKLNKVPSLDGGIPYNVKKDAHDVIMEFIRSRPPLKKASERKLKPLITDLGSLTPREQLLNAIKAGDVRLRPSPAHSPYSRKSRIEERRSSTPNGRRLIRVESSFFCADTSDEEFEDAVNSSTAGPNNKTASSPTGGLGDYPHHHPLQPPHDPSSPLHSPLPHLPPEEDRTALETGTTSPWQRTAYDLVTQLPPSVPRRAGGGAGRRHTLGVLGGMEAGTRDCTSAPVSRPDSRQTGSPESLSCTLPSEISWSRTSLQEDLLKSKQWEEECLSLTLEEIVHIRSVLTKAELESLPVECRVKEDAERRKVCFLCMKTRFGIFGPWGQICRLCKRTVCAKCYSKMRIPTEHFSHVPVVALSPSLLSPSAEDDTFPKCLAAQLGVGSAPVSPSLSRAASGTTGGNPSGRPNQQMSTSLICDGPISLPPSSPSFSPSDKWRVAKARALGRQKAEKLKGLQMTVCHDCKAMVLQIIKSSRATRDHAIRNLTLDLSPVY